MNDILYWIWLSASCVPGSESFSKLIKKFSSPLEIYKADESEISACIGSARSQEYLSLTDKSLEKAKEILSFCLTKKVGILTYSDPNYPDLLKEIKNPPVLLFYRGVLPDFNNNFFISVVGTRKISEYGRKNTFTISHDLAKAGAVIVSGMAIGIDGVALAGALSANKPTVAVIGSGIDVCYPMVHKRLAQEIVKSGCVLTEYLPGTKPLKYNFPNRNRIISALSPITLVMEGNERSGALITARLAKEQGRAVYAFPGNVGNSNSQAGNLLIKNGAILFTSADDIIRDFEFKSAGKLNPFNLSDNNNINMFEVFRKLEVSCVCSSDNIFKAPKPKKKAENQTPISNTLSEEENTINSSSLHIEGMIEDTFDKLTLKLYKKIPVGKECLIESLADDEIPLPKVMQMLLKLEIKKFITMLPGDRVKRIL